MAYPDDSLPAASTWFNGFVSAALIQANLIDQLNQLVARMKDTGWVQTGAVGLNASGSATGSGRSTIQAMAMRAIGASCWVYFSYTLGATISPVGSDGDVANTPIIQLPAAFIPMSLPDAVGSQGLMSAGGGGLVSYYVNQAGIIGVAATTASGVVTAGSTHTFSGSFAL